MARDTDVRKCDLSGKYCICPKFPCHRPNKHLTWFTFAGISYPIASTGDVDLNDPMVKAEVVLTIMQVEKEHETKKFLEEIDRTISKAHVAIQEAKKFLGR
jgi:hypothetical protein